VLVPDLPGHGRSVAREVTLEAAEEAILGMLPEGPVALVGHSLGAVLAARVAGRIGGRLDRLVLIAPAGLGPRMDGGFVELVANAFTPAALSRALRGLGQGAGPLSQEALEAEFGRLDVGRAAMVALGHALVRGGVQQVDIAPVLERVRAPITAVFGLEDPIIDWRDCASLPAGAAIHLLRGAGHLPQGVRPDLVADLILGRAARAT
jgi:pyruvate dehydrogenase E2 component (dihydrolipoamide acetyltransferase)